MPQNKGKSEVDSWLKKMTSSQRKALKNASKHFDKTDSLTVNMLEAIYGKESSFGSNRRNRGMKGAAGDFQFEKQTAERFGLKVLKKNDQRFNIHAASNAAATYLKEVDNFFKKETHLGLNIRTFPIKDADERKKFSLASINAGEGRIARAQRRAQEAGKNPGKWRDVKEYLEKAGATKSKAEEIRDYVDQVVQYEEEFAKKSPGNKNLKGRKANQNKTSQSTSGHWITKKGRRIFIED